MRWLSDTLEAIPGGAVVLEHPRYDESPKGEVGTGFFACVRMAVRKRSISTTMMSQISDSWWTRGMVKSHPIGHSGSHEQSIASSLQTQLIQLMPLPL